MIGYLASTAACAEPLPRRRLSGSAHADGKSLAKRVTRSLGTRPGRMLAGARAGLAYSSCLSARADRAFRVNSNPRPRNPMLRAPRRIEVTGPVQLDLGSAASSVGTAETALESPSGAGTLPARSTWSGSSSPRRSAARVFFLRAMVALLPEAIKGVCALRALSPYIQKKKKPTR